MRGIVISSSAIAALALALSTGTFAAGRSAPGAAAPMHPSAAPTTTTTTTTRSPAHITGQPNQSCGSAAAPNTPGNAASAGGSAFNPDGTAGKMYAGQQTQNSVNTASVSQYDVACAHQR